MASISCCAKADEADLVGNLTLVIGVGDEEDTVAELIEWPRLKGARVDYPTGSSQFREFCKAKSSIDGIWWHAFRYREINCKVSRKESFIDVIAREDNELKTILKELKISRFKRVASKDDKLARLNEILDGPTDMATISSTVVRNMAKRKAVKRGAAPRSVTLVSVDDSSKRRKVTSPTKSQEVLEESDNIAEGEDLRPRFEFARALRAVQLGFHDRSMELEKRISQLEGEKNQLEEILTRERGAFQLEREKEREAAALKLKEVRAESEAEAERLVTASAISRNNLAEKLYQLRYTKAEIMAFSKGIYEEMEIMDEEEVEEREDGLNVAEKTAADNQETINQEIESSRLRVVDLKGLLEVEKKSSAEFSGCLCMYLLSCDQNLLFSVGQGGIGCLKLVDVCIASLSVCFCRFVSPLEEYEVLFSQYDDRLDDNVKLSLKLEEAKRHVEEKIATILSRDLALNQLTSELAELKEKVASGSRHEAELAEYRIRALNEEISYMKCNIRALNEQLLKREIEQDTARTNLALSEADFEKLNNSIMGKDQELCNSVQIRDSLIARLDRLKSDLRHFKGRETQSRADLAEIQSKNQSLVDDLAHVVEM
ncbi:hypothetical protein GIB67_008630 [Kingdonia uniflora]|uniref:Uncharacterized protein n=1 Tax=Kingdonia uniflora TaxID=39325 RepID=A0A7J7M4T8_9MAGN|nr:hypothetical protein GIB67_008630 [Kingdonia uniflora]